jgi:hypothetical protein
MGDSNAYANTRLSWTGATQGGPRGKTLRGRH